MRKYSEFDNV